MLGMNSDAYGYFYQFRQIYPFESVLIRRQTLAMAVILWRVSAIDILQIRCRVLEYRDSEPQSHILPVPEPEAVSRCTSTDS